MLTMPHLTTPTLDGPDKGPRDNGDMMQDKQDISSRVLSTLAYSGGSLGTASAASGRLTFGLLGLAFAVLSVFGIWLLSRQ